MNESKPLSVLHQAIIYAGRLASLTRKQGWKRW